MTNIEALACGTPAITFNTGGSVECVDETCGGIVAQNDIDALETEIVKICLERPYSVEACVNKALKFEKMNKFNEYIALYVQ